MKLKTDRPAAKADRDGAGRPEISGQAAGRHERLSACDAELRACRLCPRACGANRLKGETGYCGMTAEIRAARAALHFWEEPCISGYGEGSPQDILSAGLPESRQRKGSGTVFFSGCNLRCVYCQNREIAAGKAGREITQERLAEIFLELQEQGACNINLVTPTPYIPQIAGVLGKARASGLGIPVVCNCGGYESVRALQLLEGLVDIYLTDFKYLDPEAACQYSAAPDYPSAARAALEEMVRQAPHAVFNADGLMTAGVIVRHLLLPGRVRDACAVADYVYDTYGDAVWLSLMRQYTPMKGAAEQYPELGRTVTAREYSRWVRHVTDRGISNCFIQERGTARESFIPPFDGEGL